MNTIDSILSRKSIRKFTEQTVSDEQLNTILKAGMAGPSAVNARPWSFLVVRDKETLNKMADGNGRAANPLRGAAVGILVCGDLERVFSRAPEYWVIDGAIAAQNMILAAHELGIGSVWLGTWPQQEKMEAQQALFSLPASVVPHSIIAFGYPAEDPDKSAKPDWEADRIHYEKW